MKIAKKFVYPGDPDKRDITLGFLDKWIDDITLHPGVDINWVVGGRRGNADLGKQITTTASGQVVYSRDSRKGCGCPIKNKDSQKIQRKQSIIIC